MSAGQIVSGYTEKILKYASDSEHVGTLEDAHGTGEAGLASGQVGTRLAVRFFLKVSGEQVEKAAFQVFGCGFTIAACAAAAELCEGRPLADIRAVSAEDIHRHLDDELPSERRYCANLASLALQAAAESVISGSVVKVDWALAGPVAPDQGPRIAADDPLLLALLSAAAGNGQPAEDSRLFAGLLTLAAGENGSLELALGLPGEQIDSLLAGYFPGFDRTLLEKTAARRRAHDGVEEPNPEVQDILRSHIQALSPQSGEFPIAAWLAEIIAARVTLPGHLWVAMGFARRAELTETIRRHFPSLAAANNRGMRWKRYLFKQICDRHGGVMCRTPNCADCSDYALCFPSDDETRPFAEDEDQSE